MNRKLRRMRRWARYINHYTHIPYAKCVGQRGSAAIYVGFGGYCQIYKQGPGFRR